MALKVRACHHTALLTLLLFFLFFGFGFGFGLGFGGCLFLGFLGILGFFFLTGFAFSLFLFGFGFAKPVPVNPFNFTNQKKRRGGMALTALAGPLSNLIMALLAIIIFAVVSFTTEAFFCIEAGGKLTFFRTTDNAWYYVGSFLIQFASINIGLAVFNLLPIPPLDGSRIFGLLFPEKWMMAIERYSFVIIMALFMILNRVSGVGDALGSLNRSIFMLIYRGVAALFSLFGVQLIL